MDESSDPPARRKGTPSRRRESKPAPSQSVKATIRLSGAAYDRLLVHAGKARISKSAVVESLILEHLRRWVVSDRGRVPDDSAEDDGEGPPLSVVA